MGIDDLRQRIFRKNADFRKRYQEPTLSKHPRDVATSWSEKTETPQTPDKAPPPELSEEDIMARKIIKWGVGGGLLFIAASLGIFLFFFSGWSGFGVGRDTVDKIQLTISGGEEVFAGKQVTWRVMYKNDNTIPLEDAVLTFEFPPGSQPIIGEFSKNGIHRERRNLKTIAAGAGGEEVFSGIVFGPERSDIKGNATLEYRPEGTSAHFSRVEEYRSFVTGTLLGLRLEIPEGLKAGQEAEVKVRIVSSAQSLFRNLGVSMEYPEAFEYVSASPAPSIDKNIWLIGDLPAGGEYTASIRGRIKKAENDQTFHARVGIYDRQDASWAIFNNAVQTFSVASSLLTVSLETEQGEVSPGVTVAGNRLQFAVKWKNNLPVAVENAMIEVGFLGSAFDLKTLRSDYGEYDDAGQKMRFVPGRIPELSLIEPGAEGEFSFQIILVKDIPQKNVNDKNFSVKLQAKIGTFEIPQGFEGVDLTGEAEEELKLASRVSFSQEGYYRDSRVQNTGPVPPRVGEETTYLVVWSIVNSLNDLGNVRVRATLPSYIKWKNIILPPDEKISYKPSTGEIIWTPETIGAGTGYSRPVREVAFQIGLKPSLPQVTSAPQLISAAALEARDLFTGTIFNQRDDQLTTNLRNDPEASQGGGVVK